MNLDKIIRVIFLFSAISLTVSLIIDVFGISITTITDDSVLKIVFLFFIILRIFIDFAAIKFLMGAYSKVFYCFICIYWILQIVNFGFLGYSFAFAYGPLAVFYVKFIGHFDWDFVLKLWHHEYAIKIGTLSERIYFGVNLVALSISSYLIYNYSNYFLQENMKMKKRKDIIDELS